MKTIKYLTAFALATVLLGSCEARYNNGNNGMPPGQAKKYMADRLKIMLPGKEKNNVAILQ